LTDSLANLVMVLYRVGKETGREPFVKRLKEELSKTGEHMAQVLKDATGTKNEDFQNCLGGLPKVFDTIDDGFGNFWDGYIENSTNVFEKEVKTCPVARQWSQEPDFCETILGEAALQGIAHALNPKFKLGFSKLLVKGDHLCRYRIEMKD
jgi:hypothetical protein